MGMSELRETTAGEPAQESSQIAEIRAAASVLIERMQFMQRAGISFNGLRDMYTVLGYDRILQPTDYRERYERGGIAGRIVDAFPKATWRGGGELVEDEDPKVSTEFEKAWIAFDARLNVWPTFLKVDLLSGLGRYAVLLIGAPGELNVELKKGDIKKITTLTAFAEEDAKIQEWETDISSERFGFPRFYQLGRTTGTMSSNDTSSGTPAFVVPAFNLPVHWSRIIHIAQNTLYNEVFGQPVLKRVWNLLDDLDKVTGGGAEAFWLRANQGLQLDVDKDMKITEDEKVALKEQADEYSNQMRRMLRTRGVQVNTLGSDVANFSNPADAILTQIAGATSIPKRILTGSEMGELASSQDRDNWKDQIDGRQRSYAGPFIVKRLVDRLVAYGYLPEPKKAPDAYVVKFPHIQTLTEDEKASGASKWALTKTDEGPVFSRDEIRDKWYGMEPWPKPILDESTGTHTAPDSGLEVSPKMDPETGLPFKGPAAPEVVAVDPETGLPMVDPDTGEPIVVDPKTQLPIKKEDKPVPEFDKATGKMILPKKKEEPPKKVLPFQRRAAEENSEVLAVLEAAIRENNTDVIDAIIGITHVKPVMLEAIPAPPIINVTIQNGGKTKKTVEYADVAGQMRPHVITEEPE